MFRRLNESTGRTHLFNDWTRCAKNRRSTIQVLSTMYSWLHVNYCSQALAVLATIDFSLLMISACKNISLSASFYALAILEIHRVALTVDQLFRTH